MEKLHMSDPIINNITISVTGTIDASMSISLDTSGLVIIDAVPEPPEPTPPPNPIVEPLLVELDYEGKTYVFDESIGIDLGDYVEPGGHFIQLCLLTTHPELPGFRVMFRPDADGKREEIVFELGMLFSGTPYNMTNYTVRIKRAGQTITTIQAPVHYWNCRWRWQSAPRPVIYSATDLIEQGAVPAYSEDLFGSGIPLSTPRVYTNPMDLAGITPYIPSTGERDEIGPCTEAQAEYLCMGSSSALSSMRAQLEASGSIPLHFRDENTNAPLDWGEYPNATMYTPNGADPYIHNPSGGVVTLDAAHMGSFAYVPFMLTGDPYALEWIQFTAVYNVVCLSPGARANFSLGNAVRAVAWALRSLVHAATVIPDTVPNWFLPRSIFKSRLDDQKKWFMDKYVNGTTKPCSDLWILQTPENSPGSATSVPPAGTYVSIWMEDFLTTILGWTVALGHSDWLPILEWKAKDAMARTNGTSGWIRAVPTMYQCTTREGPTGPSVTSWRDAWTLNVKMNPTVCVYQNANTFATGANITYASYMLGALAESASGGIIGAQECYNWLLDQLQRSTTPSRYIRRRWAIASV
jgi:hypothetical protein